MYEDQNSVLGRAVFEEKPLPISDRDAKLEQLDSQMAELSSQLSTFADVLTEENEAWEVE